MKNTNSQFYTMDCRFADQGDGSIHGGHATGKVHGGHAAGKVHGGHAAGKVHGGHAAMDLQHSLHA